jgi:hypothetical protein
MKIQIFVVFFSSLCVFCAFFPVWYWSSLDLQLNSPYSSSLEELSLRVALCFAVTNKDE